jgi:ABC-2 type transport system permease protein
VSTDLRPVVGPTALGADRQRFWHLTQALALTDFKLKFFGSVLGYVWQLARPFALFGVLYVVFTQVLKFGEDVILFPVALLLGLVLYSFFAEATGGSLTSLLDRENLVRKVDFPRLAVPLSVILTALMNLGLNLIAVTVFLLASGGEPRLSWLQLPFILLGLTILVFGIGMLLSPMFVRYRDVQPIWDVVMQITLYASPVIYPIELALAENEKIAQFLMFNPFAALLQQARHAFIHPSHPTAAEAIGGAEWLLVPGGITVVLLIVGYRIFSREAPLIAERL